MSRSPEDTIAAARAMERSQRDLADAEREFAAESIRDRGYAYLWTPACGVVCATTMTRWDAAARGARGD